MRIIVDEKIPLMTANELRSLGHDGDMRGNVIAHKFYNNAGLMTS